MLVQSIYRAIGEVFFNINIQVFAFTAYSKWQSIYMVNFKCDAIAAKTFNIESVYKITIS